MKLEDTYDRRVAFIRDGTVHRRDGRPLRLRDLIKQRWGWPKRASDLAAEVIRRDAGDDDAILYVSPREQLKQQRWAIDQCPDIADSLLLGLARGKVRELPRNHKTLVGVVVDFYDDEVNDEGLSSEILAACARHFGESYPVVADATDFDTDEFGRFRMTIHLEELPDDLRSGV